MKLLNPTRVLATLTLLLSFTLPGTAVSQDWEYSGNLYLWGAGIQGELANGAEIDASFGDILEELDFALMGGFEGNNGKWIWGADAIYLNIGADRSGTIPPMAGGPGLSTNADIDIKGNIFTLLGGRVIRQDASGNFNVVFGLRYLDVDTGLRLSSVAAGPRVSVSAKQDALDFIIGVRGRKELNENWFLPYHLDFGFGDSESPWTAVGGFGRYYGWGEMVFAYRHMEWSFDSSEPIRDIDFSGPVVQARWNF